MTAPPLAHWISRSAGLILLVAAALKVYGLAVAPIAAAGVFSAPEVQVALINGEMLLGIWLVSGKQPLGAWLTAVAVFACFAGTSFYLGWVGQASCGCLGAVPLNPWYAFAADVVVLSALGLGRPDFNSVWQKPGTFLIGAARTLASGALGVAGLFGLLVLAAWLAFGSPRAALAYFRGEVVSVTPRVLDLGRVPAGSDHRVTLELTNWSDQPVRVIGGTSDCSCYANENLPLTIEAGQSLPVTITFRLPRMEGFFRRDALFRTDCNEAPVVQVQVVGRIVEP
jgi:hypothetical protein